MILLSDLLTVLGQAIDAHSPTEHPQAYIDAYASLQVCRGMQEQVGDGLNIIADELRDLQTALKKAGVRLPEWLARALEHYAA